MKKIAKLSLFTLIFLNFLVAPEFIDAEEKTKYGEVNITNKNMTDKMIQYQMEYITNKDIKKTFEQFMNEKEDFKNKKLSFKDVTTEEWFYQDLLFANRYGLVEGKGSEEIFAPQDKLTRAEAAAVMQRFCEREK